jgi:hypothetical protein
MKYSFKLFICPNNYILLRNRSLEKGGKICGRLSDTAKEAFGELRQVEALISQRCIFAEAWNIFEKIINAAG